MYLIKSVESWQKLDLSCSCVTDMVFSRAINQREHICEAACTLMSDGVGARRGKGCRDEGTEV